MILPVEFLAGADVELQEVFNRSEDYCDGSGARLLTVVSAYLSRIAVFPEIAPIYLKRIRRQVIRNFPYGIFYEPHPTRIVVVAVLDLRQDKRQIIRRLRR